MKQIIRTSGFILPLITMLWLAGCSKENILLQEEKSGVEGAAATNATSGQTAEDSRFVDGAYIVVFKDDVTDI